MLNKSDLAWAVVDAYDGKLVVWDGHAPIYWRRSVAVAAANEHGCSTSGRDPDVRVCRVSIKQYSTGRGGSR